MDVSMIGAYGPWAATPVTDQPAALSFRRAEWADIESWRTMARQRVLERLAQPPVTEPPPVTVHRQYEYDGLMVEELSWQLPYGPPTEAVFLKPARASGKLPGILALHDHAANKFYGHHKLVQTSAERPEMMQEHQAEYYGGRAWANEVAKRGYAVLVPDVYAFASRRVRLSDVPEVIKAGLPDKEPDTRAEIEAYNHWAATHESIMAKSLFCAGTTWPGVVLTEDQCALSILCQRVEVDTGRVGCGGLSGGGLRIVTGFAARWVWK